MENTDIIYRKIREFFLSEFQMNTDEMIFSLVKYAGIPVDDTGFVTGDAQTLSNAAITEEFSDLVKAIPVYSNDLLVFEFDMMEVQELYTEILESAKHINSGINGSETNAFEKILADAKQQFNDNRLDSTRGMFMVNYAEPENWYANSSLWKSHSFVLDNPADTPVLRLMRGVDLSGLKPGRSTGLHKKAPQRLLKNRIGLTTDHRKNTITGTGIKIAAPVDKALLFQAASALAPTQSTQTKNFTVSFEYIRIGILRKWMSMPLMFNTDWYIGGKEKGYLTKPPFSDDIRPNLYAIPNSVVMIRNLEISSENWAPEEMARICKEVFGFSMFNMANNQAGNNKIRVPEIQVIGCTSRKMTTLPPNSSL